MLVAHREHHRSDSIPIRCTLTDNVVKYFLVDQLDQKTYENSVPLLDIVIQKNDWYAVALREKVRPHIVPLSKITFRHRRNRNHELR
jgi:hypothetical protein